MLYHALSSSLVHTTYYLPWSYCQPRIVETIMGSTATTTSTTTTATTTTTTTTPSSWLSLPDLVCLQEVQVNLWETNLKPSLFQQAAAVSKSRTATTFSDSYK